MWPAPPTAEASPWAAQLAFEQAVRANASVARNRPKPKPVRAPAPKPRVVAEPPRRSPPSRRGPDSVRGQGIIGVAAVTGVWMRPECKTKPNLEALMYTHQAFDKTLSRVKAGRKTVRLHFVHDDEITFASTADGGLEVWMEGNELCFRVRPRTLGARMVIAAAEANPYVRQASVGVSTFKWHPDGGNANRMIVTEGWLWEISLVPAGACPGTRFALVG